MNFEKICFWNNLFLGGKTLKFFREHSAQGDKIQQSHLLETVRKTVQSHFKTKFSVPLFNFVTRKIVSIEILLRLFTCHK